jgi:sugar-specific transcriptional regulator TrmB
MSNVGIDLENMAQKILQSLGFSPNEAKIYEALLRLNEAGVGEIASETDIHRRSIYDAVNRLIDKGLIFQILSKHEHTYAPVDPDKLMELMQEKQKSLEAVLPDLKREYERERREQEAYIYKGVEGFKNYMRDILREGKDAYFIAANLGWFDPKLEPFTTQFLKEAERLNLSFHHLFDAEVKEKGCEVIERMARAPHKFIPSKYSTGSAIEIFGDYVVTFTGVSFRHIDENVTLFVLRDKNLANSYRTWFQMVWDLFPDL